MKYLSVCSGIEAATRAFEPLGWIPIGFSEIEVFPSAVLKHHYSETPNFGDMSNYESWNFTRPGPESDDFLLCGGTPCQSFSVSGLRKGLSDERGNLTLTFVKLADFFNPDWIIWENVPGVLSSKDNAFGCFLAGLCGESEPYIPLKKWTKSGVVSGPKRTVAWRVQDAQYHGVAQRRRRVFVVAVPGTDNWECAQALFPVGEGMFWDTPKSRETAKETPGDARKSTQGSSGESKSMIDIDPAGSLCARSPGYSVQDFTEGHMVCMATGQTNAEILDNHSPTLNTIGEQPIIAWENHPQDSRVKEMGDVCSSITAKYGTGGGNVPLISFKSNMGSFVGEQDGISPTLMTDAPNAVAFNTTGGFQVTENNVTPTLDTSAGKGGHQQYGVRQGMMVRRLMPEECELLQGFPMGYTRIPWRNKDPKDCPDGPRYKALGNSMAVPCMRFIGERIQMIKDQHGR